MCAVNRLSHMSPPPLTRAVTMPPMTLNVANKPNWFGVSKRAAMMMTKKTDRREITALVTGRPAVQMAFETRFEEVRVTPPRLPPYTNQSNFKQNNNLKQV